MYTEFHGLPENPFAIVPNPRLAWLGAGTRKVRAELCQAALQGRGLMLVTGGPGVGKSLVLTLLAEDLKESEPNCQIHALNCRQEISATELLQRLADDVAGGDGGPVTDQLIVLLIDEAQHLSPAELSVLLQGAVLYGHRLSLVLAGTPEFELAVHEVLAEHPVAFAGQWSLEPLAPDEVRSYIDGRLQAAGASGREIFTGDAIRCLSRHSGGVPRRLNVLCSTALFVAWREGRRDVDATIAEAALHPTEPLTDFVESPQLEPLPTLIHELSDASALEVKKLPIAVFQPALLDAPAAYASSGSVGSEVNEPVTCAAGSMVPTRSAMAGPAAPPGFETPSLQAPTNVASIAVTAIPASREIAQILEHRPVAPAIRPQARPRRVLYAIPAGFVAVVSLLLAADWRAHDERSDEPTNPPAEPSPIMTTKQPIVVSVHVDPQFAEQGSSTSGQSPPQTIGAAELAGLLTRARQQIAAFALTTPPGDNAFETLQRVLAVMPTQPDALQGIRDIASRYALLAAQAHQRGESDLAMRYLDKGLRLVPDHPELLAVQRQLAAKSTFESGRPTDAGRLRMVPNRSPGSAK